MFPGITTERLLLRQVQPQDHAFIFEGLSHPHVIRHYGVRFDSFEATKAQMEWYEQLWREGTGISWIITDKQTHENMGDISVYHYQQEHKKAEVGFWLLPQFWKKGYACEALHAVLRYWVEEKGLHRMEAFVEEENLASAKLLEKAGFEKEGLMKDCEWKNGRFISLLVYGWINK